MPVEPVPTKPTRWPAKSTPSCGHSAVWKHAPSKSSSPAKSGRLIDDRLPTPEMQYRAVTRSPAAVTSVHVFASSS